MTATLPEPRSDGLCAGCGRRRAVTRDRRYCRACLRAVVEDLTPELPSCTQPAVRPAPAARERRCVVCDARLAADRKGRHCRTCLQGEE